MSLEPAPASAPQLPSVNWEIAARTGKRLVKPGPEATREEVRAVVDSLRRASAHAADHVREVTRLDAPRGSADVLIVDRKSWIDANTQSFHLLLASTGLVAEPVTTGQRVVGATSGAQIGTLLAYLAPKVLGQFDPFGPRGRLLLIAPNVLAIERELHVDPDDFRLWVCLHEETHRVQFTHTPWLAEHLRDQLGHVMNFGDVSNIAEALGRLRNRRDFTAAIASDESTSLVDLISTPEQKLIIDKVTAVMSLLEGHADVMMDQVGPDVIPTVATIRAKFNRRRGGQGLDRIVRQWLGLEAKMRQYRDGANFCRHVIDEVGLDGFNRVFTSPNTLPGLDEIQQPRLWVERMFAR